MPHIHAWRQDLNKRSQVSVRSPSAPYVRIELAQTAHTLEHGRALTESIGAKGRASVMPPICGILLFCSWESAFALEKVLWIRDVDQWTALRQNPVTPMPGRIVGIQDSPDAGLR